MRDEFLSEEDLDLGQLSWEELLATWNAWLRQAQATNEADRWVISHGVFEEVPEAARFEEGAPRKRPHESDEA